jgi:hypothetical protein
MESTIGGASAAVGSTSGEDLEMQKQMVNNNGPPQNTTATTTANTADNTATT